MIPQAVSFSGRYLNEAGVMLTPIFADEEMTILAKEDNQGQREYIKTSLFAQKLLNGDIQEVLPQRVAPVMTKQQEIAFKRKLAYVKTLHEIVNAPGKDLAPTTQAAFEELKSRLLATQPELVYDCMPGRTTICSYWHTWVTNGYDDNSLMPKKRKQSIRLDPISEEYLEERIFKDFCNGQHHNLTACYRAYKSDVDGEDNEIKAVSLSTYRRRVLNMSEFEHRLKDPNLHPSERSKIFSTLRKKIKLNYAGERIEVDRMSPNLCLIDDETGLPTEKVDIYIAFDAYSRVPVGVTLEFGQGENKESVTRLIQSIYESDNFLPTSIKPHELVADNGSGFNNSIFHKLGEGLGVTVTYNPAYSPMMKPFVESFNNTMRKKFFEGFPITLQNGERHIGIPGYRPKRTESNLPSKPLKQLAQVTVSDFRKHLNRFLTEYINTVHSQTGETPLERWNASLMMRSKANSTYDEVSHAFHVFTKTSTYKLQDRGYVSCFAQKYSSNDLKKLYLRLQTFRSGKPEVTIRYYPFDIRRITVVAIDPKTGEEISLVVPMTNLEEHPHPISYEESKGTKPKALDIYMRPYRGEFSNEVDSVLHNVKVPKKRSGNKVRSFEENHDQALSVGEKITQANRNVEGRLRNHDANLTIEHGDQETKAHSNQQSNHSDEADLWED